jgi:predicted phosphohydrolase
MALFAISDLHLSLSGEKPMYVFGDAWQDHHLKLKENWERIVSHDDTVLLGGDLSWAMKLEDAAPDFQFIDALPGQKILLKGNHDYWWQSLTKIKKALPPGMIPLQNDYLLLDENIALCGTRGWTYPAPPCDTEHDKKIYNRELIRLELSLEAAGKENPSAIIVTLHYPPFTSALADTGFTEIMRRYNVKACLYGHLHGPDQSRAFIGMRDGIRYHFISADYLNFSPLLIDVNYQGIF